MTIIIKRSALKDTWLLSCVEILKNGKKIHDERGQNTLEVRNLIMETINPFNQYQNVKSIWTPKDFMFSRDYLNEYAEQLLDPEDKDFVYDYGNRLRGYFLDDKDCPIDQIEEVIKKLKNNQNSRRAIAITIDPVIDNKEEDIPCLQQLTFLIRDSKLYITALFRSNDIGMAAFANQYGLLYIGTHIAKRLGINVGALTVHSVSAHIYETDIEAIKYILSKNGWDF